MPVLVVMETCSHRDRVITTRFKGEFAPMDGEDWRDGVIRCLYALGGDDKGVLAQKSLVEASKWLDKDAGEVAVLTSATIDFMVGDRLLRVTMRRDE